MLVIRYMYLVHHLLVCISNHYYAFIFFFKVLHPSQTFDLNYIRLFRTLASTRLVQPTKLKNIQQVIRLQSIFFSPYLLAYNLNKDFVFTISSALCLINLRPLHIFQLLTGTSERTSVDITLKQVKLPSLEMLLKTNKEIALQSHGILY